MGEHETYRNCRFIVDGEPCDLDLQDLEVTCDYEEIKSHFPLESPVDMTAEFEVVMSPEVIKFSWFVRHMFFNNWRKQHGLPMIRRKALKHVHH